MRFRLSLCVIAVSCAYILGAQEKSGAPDPRLDGVRAVMRDAIQRRQIPGGSLLMIHDGETILREGFGVADLETGRPFQPDDLCFIASLSKPVASTLMILLDQRGTFSLDDPVGKWLPDFKNIQVKGRATASPPLIWQLLSHRSGLPGNDDPGAVRGRGGRPPALADAVSGWARAGLLAEPGARYAYGNAGYVVASAIVQAATGRTFEALEQELIFESLGMSRTTYRPSAKELQEMPRRYRRKDRGLELDSGIYPVPAADGWVNPAGGLFSTLDDLGRFALVHLQKGKTGGRQIIPAASLARMYQPHPATGAYGLGWNVMGGSGVRHIGGSGTFLWLDFENNAAVVLFTQVPWEGDSALTQRLMAAVRSFYKPGAAPR
jgi:CubicO group peptidase (beta-lactamase class C family)